ncbi:MAG: AAA family ATPase [Opitutaceae bacterium]|nr:AAA family ATPase [Opitutaceae bacterium]
MTPPDAPVLSPLFQPALFLSRLVILRHGLVVYDQPFHTGVNIIRGTNSHGKSTIADFIFYVLGGDLSRWKPEAETCDVVIAEVLANGAILTLKREVTAKGSQPLYIYYGSRCEEFSAVKLRRNYVVCAPKLPHVSLCFIFE